MAPLARLLPTERAPVPADTAVDFAFATAPSVRETQLVALLDAVAGRSCGKRE